MKRQTLSATEPHRISVRAMSASSLREEGERGRRNADIADRLLSLQEDIQRQIASDLHDSTCQHLVAATLGLLRLKHATSETGAAARICDDIDASIKEALREIRAVSYLLFPQNLLNDGLKSTIEGYVNGFSARTSLKCTVEITPEVRRLRYETQSSLLRFIQEALANVFRHANATKVKIAIEARKKDLRLRVIDNGCGFPTSRAKSGSEAISFGVGIPGMRNRVRQLGGTFEIHSSAGRHPGTTVCAVLPYPMSREALLPQRPHDHLSHR
jgi:two-component system, NarL family, sensor kinase